MNSFRGGGACTNSRRCCSGIEATGRRVGAFRDPVGFFVMPDLFRHPLTGWVVAWKGERFDPVLGVKPRSGCRDEPGMTGVGGTPRRQHRDPAGREACKVVAWIKL